jgi:hypothetical protein
MFIPYVIDNQTHKMRDVLTGLLKEHEGCWLDMATAYFNVGYGTSRTIHAPTCSGRAAHSGCD